MHVTPIHEVQGSTAASPMVGETVLIEGVVVGDFQDRVGANGDLDGFYVQEESGDWDADPATSEGVFVFDGESPEVDVAINDRVRVQGRVRERFGETQVTDVVVEVLAQGEGATPLALALPFDRTVTNADGELIADLEAVEGMLVEFSAALYVTELFNLDRFGELRLAETGRQFQFTNSNAPDEAGFVARRSVMLDDGSA